MVLATKKRIFSEAKIKKIDNKKTEDNTMNKIMNLQKQLIVTIDEDEWFDSPREWDNLGALYTWEGGYCSPDKHNFSDGLEFLGSIIGE